MTQSNAYPYRMPFGIPGALSRSGQGVVEAHALGAIPIPAYGFPVKMVGQVIRPMNLNNDTNPFGWLVRPFPTQDDGNEAIAVGAPPAAQGTVLNILKRGYMSVWAQANAASVAAGGKVYMRYANPSGAAVVGGIEGLSIPGTNVALLHCYFTGPTDDAGNTEIYFRASGRTAVSLAGAAVSTTTATGAIP